MTAEAPRNPVVTTALAHVTHLATLPHVTARILQLVEDPDVNAGELERLVLADAVLAARVLKVVNSAFYGRPASVNSIRQAIVMIGFPGLRVIALAASLTKLFRVTNAYTRFNPRGPWLHSAAAATAARLIAERLGGDREELFLAGLLHDVGTVVALQALRNGYIDLLSVREASPDDDYLDLERRMLKTTHQELGLGLCDKWNFSATMRAAVGFHHDPTELEGDARRVAAVVHVADRLAAEAEIGFCCTANRDNVFADVVDELGLTGKVLDDVRRQLPEAATDAAELCD